MQRRTRRVLAGVLVVLGVAMMVMAPASAGGSPALGVVLLLAGVLVEAIGLVLEHRA
ncbi:MAG: hypothetical protein H6983_10445 [Ectothiorhodospiraceae bacterium]|nr:hypothetical protein [Chromatiales bacterium]MCP5154575.1 hypothetical protein [Ectothiorhodospiraceae bacterium]